MTTLGKYCKSFPLQRFREFSGWTEDLNNARRVRQEIAGKKVEVARSLSDTDYLYLQENFTVTDSIFIDENIIFDKVTSAWIDFCVNVLGVDFPAKDDHREN
jgi:hypothetical protein